MRLSTKHRQTFCALSPNIEKRHNYHLVFFCPDWFLAADCRWGLSCLCFSQKSYRPTACVQFHGWVLTTDGKSSETKEPSSKFTCRETLHNAPHSIPVRHLLKQPRVAKSTDIFVASVSRWKDTDVPIAVIPDLRRRLVGITETHDLMIQTANSSHFATPFLNTRPWSALSTSQATERRTHTNTHTSVRVWNIPTIRDQQAEN